MKRRRLLALCGSGLAGLSGCLSQDSNPPSATETLTHPPAEMDVSFSALQPTVIILYHDAYGAESTGKHLYLTASNESDEPILYSDFRFRLDGTEYEPEDTENNHYYVSPHTETRRHDQGSGWVMFALPERADASDAALLWPGGKWRPPEQVRARLAAPLPELSVEWDPPETVTPDTEFTIDLSVTNDGAVPSRFVAGLDQQGVGVPYSGVGTFSRRIPANETVSWTFKDSAPTVDLWPDSEGETSVQYELHWSGTTKSHLSQVVQADAGQ